MQKGGEGERGGGGEGERVWGRVGEGERGGEGRGDSRRRSADTATYPTYSFVEENIHVQYTMLQSFFYYSTCIFRLRKSLEEIETGRLE